MWLNQIDSTAGLNIYRATSNAREPLSMRVLIQDAATRAYCSSLDSWSLDPANAFDFEHSAIALKFLQEHDLTHVHVILKFPDDRLDIKLETDHFRQATDT